MRLKRLQLINFKNLNLVADFSDRVNLVIGLNGTGKTNLLESIYFLSRFESFRTDDIKEIVPWNTDQKFFQIGASIVNDREYILEVNVGIENGLTRKKLTLDGIKKNRPGLLHFLPVFVFLPRDLDLINGSPKLRRNELDNFIEMINPAYTQIRSRYNKVLISRNKLIKQILERNVDVGHLNYWDDKLVEYGSQIIEERLNIINEFKPYLQKTSDELFPDKIKNLTLLYISKLIDGSDDFKNNFKHKLSTGRFKEMAACRTLYGPQRDDFEIYMGSMNVQKAGSRGQQRLATLLIKFAMYKFYEEKTGNKACILLDDVMSELDDANKLKLEKIIQKLDTQIIFTSTTEADFSEGLLRIAKKIRI